LIVVGEPTPAAVKVDWVKESNTTLMVSMPRIVEPVVSIAVANADPLRFSVSESVEELSTMTSLASMVASVPFTVSFAAVIATTSTADVTAKSVRSAFVAAVKLL